MPSAKSTGFPKPKSWIVSKVCTMPDTVPKRPSMGAMAAQVEMVLRDLERFTEMRWRVSSMALRTATGPWSRYFRTSHARA